MEQLEGLLKDFWAFYEKPALGSVYWPAGGVVFYFAVLLVLKLWMRSKPKGYYDNALRPFLVVHNFFLSFISLVMVVGIVKTGIETYLKESLYVLYCGHIGAPEKDDVMAWWAYFFYLTKYYEFLDTFFLVLRKSELTFLHVFHHSSVVLVCWYALQEEIVMGWITCLNNASIHVVMYYYYALQALSQSDIWWKKYLTSLQMVQFTFDCITSLFFLYFKWRGDYCRGSWSAWLVGNGMGIVFFFLFANFYIQTYRRRKQKAQ